MSSKILLSTSTMEKEQSKVGMNGCSTDRVRVEAIGVCRGPRELKAMWTPTSCVSRKMGHRDRLVSFWHLLKHGKHRCGLPAWGKLCGALGLSQLASACFGGALRAWRHFKDLSPIRFTHRTCPKPSSLSLSCNLEKWHSYLGENDHAGAGRGSPSFGTCFDDCADSSSVQVLARLRCNVLG